MIFRTVDFMQASVRPDARLCRAWDVDWKTGWDLVKPAERNIRPMPCRSVEAGGAWYFEGAESQWQRLRAGDHL